MSALYDGRPGQITLPTALTVTNVSNANPATVTVSGALPAEFFLGGTGYGGNPAGPTVDISGVQGATGANGIWTATPTGASTFTIPTGSPPGAYTSGGSVQPLYLASLYTLPVDGDADNSASIATWGQATGDRTQWLASRTGYTKLAGRTILQHAFGPNAVWAHIASGAIAPGTWSSLTADLGLSVFGAEQGCLSVAAVGTGGGLAAYAVSGVSSSDIVHVSLECNVNNLSGQNFLGLFWVLTLPGASAPAFGAFGLVTGSVRYPTGYATTPQSSMRLSGWLSHPGNGTLWIAPAEYSVSGSTSTIQLIDDANLEFECWRVTGMPQ